MPEQKLTIKSLLSLDVEDWMKFNKQQMFKALKKLEKQTNTRYKNTKKYNTPAYNMLLKSGGDLNVSAEDSLAKMRKDFKRATKFLSSKTSTIKGYKDMEKKIYGSYSGKLTNEDKKLIWETYRKIEEGDLVGVKLYGSDKLLTDVINKFNSNIPLEQIIDEAFSEFKDIYENTESPWDDIIFDEELPF